MIQSGKEWKERILTSISRVIVGKEETITLLLTAFLAEGHVLLEDVPGTGKTRLAKTLAALTNADYSRIQFTPDLLPGDITGMNIYDRRTNQFVLRKGPVFTNILLADEINRATPRTQAGLLECMEERQVTIDGESLPLEEPFFVIATQNPVETAGTFPLPEAQLDRFTMKLSMGLPQKEQELSILERYLDSDPLDSVESILTGQDLTAARKEAGQVFIHPCVREYLVDLVEGTRNHPQTILGASPRGSLALMRCAKAYAWLDGRTYVTPDDIKTLAVPVLAHRIVMDFGMGGSRKAAGIVEAVLDTVTVPTEDFTL